ncbi:MAG: peptidylprolyl isomerase [Clostridia bacterium]|nr:peptidylprolyl isomerase [Clostridia bacterium]
MKRFNRAVRALCAVLAIVLCLGCMAGCSSRGEVVMELGNQSITANMYAFWLARYKAFFVYYYMNNQESDEMWNLAVGENGKTLNETFTDYVKDNARTYVAALYLYDQYGLKLSAAAKQQIEDDMAELVASMDGKTALNAELANYAVNYDILKEIYTIEAKVNQLQDYMFAAGGPNVLTDAQKQQYYTENYARIEHIFISTGAKYQMDETGAYVTDENGEPVTVELTEAELAAQKQKADEVVAKLTAGEDFAALLPTYTEDTATTQYPNGYYFTRTSSYVTEVIDATFAMEENTWQCVESDLGYHIIRRLPLEDGGYALEANADFFTDFESNLTVQAFTDAMAPYMEDVIVYDEVADLYSLKSVNANYQY